MVGLPVVAAWAVLLAVFTIVVGLPLYLLFRLFKVSWPIFFVAMAASIATVIYILPEVLINRSSHFGFSTRDCQVFVQGVRTACGWQDFWRGMTVNAVGGAVSGLIFYWLLRRERTDTGTNG
jgi:hypothetical protein